MALLKQVALAVCVLAILCGGVVLRLHAQSRPSTQLSETQVKAAFLFNFMKFVEWPLPDAQTRPYAICIAGPDDVRHALAALLTAAGESGRGFAVRALPEGDDPRECHSVFIAAGEARRTSAIIGQVARAAVLTVGETPSFLREGGIVRLYVNDNRLRFQIDPVGARSARLKVSAQLLSLGQ